MRRALLAALVFLLSCGEPKVHVGTWYCGRWENQILDGWENGCTPWSPGCHRRVRNVWYCVQDPHVGYESHFVEEPPIGK